MKIVITGGHHSSAMPVIKKFQQDGHSIVWFGHKHSLQGNKNTTLEYREITSMGIKFFDLHAGKFYKTFNPVRLIKIPFGFVQALYLLSREKPDVILSFGGYLAVPTVIAGSILHIPSVTHEQTITVGYANKVISKFADKILVTWKESIKYFPKEKTILSGLPLRESIFKADSNKFTTHNDLPTLYITAGKTGSHKINTTVLAALPELLKFCNVIHQSGDHSKFADYEYLSNLYTEIKASVPGEYFLEKFVLEDSIGAAYSAANLVVSRAGAHTAAEVVALRKPTLFIPIPWVSHNEQYLNAKNVVELGLGEILEESDLTAQNLLTNIKNMLDHIADYVSSERAPQKLDSANIIANEVYKTANKK